MAHRVSLTDGIFKKTGKFRRVGICKLVLTFTEFPLRFLRNCLGLALHLPSVFLKFLQNSFLNVVTFPLANLWYIFKILQPESDGSRSGSSLSLRGIPQGCTNVAANSSAVQSPAHRTVHRSSSATNSKPSRRASSGGETIRESTSTTPNPGANHNILCSLLPYSPLPVSLMARANETILSRQGRKKSGKCDFLLRAFVVNLYV